MNGDARVLPVLPCANKKAAVAMSTETKTNLVFMIIAFVPQQRPRATAAAYKQDGLAGSAAYGGWALCSCFAPPMTAKVIPQNVDYAPCGHRERCATDQDQKSSRSDIFAHRPCSHIEPAFLPRSKAPKDNQETEAADNYENAQQSDSLPAG